jgi:uncharacterized Zn-finger protein
MFKSQPKLCAACRRARDDPHFEQPMRPVHPVTFVPMLYDVCGEAVCPDCGARRRRDGNAVKLVE